MSDLGKRVASGLVLGPLVLLLVWWGSPAFALLAAAGAFAIVWEWSRITRSLRSDGAAYLAAATAGLAVITASAGHWLAAAAVLAAGVASAQLLARRGDNDRLLWLGSLYGALPAGALVVLRGDPEWGLAAVFWVIFLVWATDIGAFFAGRFIGGPKLWPAVSPKKTWSGAAGGVVAALFIGWIFLYVVLPEREISWPLLALAIGLSVAAQLGDLAESSLKRRFGVKDSSNLIPGHGGVMDRVDGLIAAAFVAGLVGAVRAGPEAAGSGLLVW